METSDNRFSVWSGYGVVFGVGFAGLAAQSLLFRKFLSVFEGNELGVALFFGSWLLWVAAGALLARGRWCGSERFDRWFDLLPLAYIPAYLLQSWLILSARDFAGIRSYELFPLAKMMLVLVPANAPVSLCTGALFTAACAWMARRTDAPVSRVYIAESAGGVAGGAVVTLLLARGAATETVALAAAGTVAGCFACSHLAKGFRFAVWIPLLLVAAAGFSGAGRAGMRADDLRRWERLLPGEAFGGGFSTPQARYLYGEHRGQFSVMAWESVAESLPGTEHASQIIAVHLAQHPAARRFLVAGPGSLALCRRLLDLPQAESVTWLDPDPDYPARLLDVLPPRFLPDPRRLTVPGADVRHHLAAEGPVFDLMILNLPDAGTLALSRYFTREFFLLVRRRLASSGVVGVRVAGGENYMGDERVNAGATIYATLRSVFARVAVKPGDETWLMASDSGALSASPTVLRDRFASVPGAAALYPPDALLPLYPPDRITFQQQSYEDAARRLPERLRVNTDRHPKSLLHGLLLAARQAGARIGAARAIRVFAERGGRVVPFALCLFAVLIAVHRRRARARDRAGSYGVGVAGVWFLIGTTGLAGMAVSLVLMFMYQSEFGSLYLHVGLVSALFMAGLAAGGAAGQYAARRWASATARVAAAGVLAHALLLGLLLAAPLEMGQAAYALLFAASGLCGGFHVPVAAALLRREGLTAQRSGAAVEFVDHVGGAAGGLAAGLFLLPLFGAPYTLAVLAGLLLINLPVLMLPREAGAASPAAGSALRLRRTGFALFGVAALALGVARLLSGRVEETGLQADRAVVRAMAGSLAVDERTGTRGDGVRFPFFVLLETGGQTNSFAVSTRNLAPDIAGYAGPVTLVMRVAPDGVLLDLRVVASRETPSYLDSLDAWMRGLPGHRLFDAGGLAGVDAVTGATMTSDAILRTLQTSGRGFGEQVLSKRLTGAATVRRFPDLRPAFLLVLAALALAARHRPRRASRWAFLTVVAAVAGVWFNTQYSLPHVLSLLALRLPTAGWNSAFLLVAGVPLLVLLFGNVYCGYLCPFGALQELAGRLRPASCRPGFSASVWRWGRMPKYVLLAAVVVLFAVAFNPQWASSDPLATAFARHRGGRALAWVGGLLLSAVFYGRFWCRVICPAGAFLALLGRARLLRRFLPGVNPTLCVYGVADERDPDCLCCDRCRMTTEAERAALSAERARAAPGMREKAFLCLAALLALGLLRLAAVAPPTAAAAAAGGPSARVAANSMRKADMDRLHERIRRRELSDHEALHAVPVAETPPQ